MLWLGAEEETAADELGPALDDCDELSCVVDADEAPGPEVATEVPDACEEALG